jgi:peptide/nickel transport system permease protein
MRIVKRLSMMVLVVWFAASLNFILPRLTDRNPVEEVIAQAMGESGGTLEGIEDIVAAYEARFGLDQPLWRQYLWSLWDSVRFELGISISFFPEKVSTLVFEALPWSIALMGTATVLSFIIGTALGAATVWPGAPRVLIWFVPIVMVLAAIPFYLVGLMLIAVLANGLSWLPSGGGYSPGVIAARSWSFAWDVFVHSLMPAASILLASLGIWALSMRGMMVTVQGEDYMTLAKAKGLAGWRRFWRYAVRNAIAPQVTTLVLAFGNIVTGAVLVERVFGYPGLGNLLFQAILVVDFFLIFGCVYLLILTVAVSLTVLDLIYPLIDPRIRAGADA